MAETKKAAVMPEDEAQAENTGSLADLVATIAKLQAENVQLKTKEKELEKPDEKARRLMPPPDLSNEKKVAVNLFLDNDKYSDDVFVGINGRNYLIRRGETVMVPESVAQVLKDSEAQRQASFRFMREKQEEFQKGTNEMRL